LTLSCRDSDWSQSPTLVTNTSCAAPRAKNKIGALVYTSSVSVHEIYFVVEAASKAAFLKCRTLIFSINFEQCPFVCAGFIMLTSSQSNSFQPLARTRLGGQMDEIRRPAVDVVGQ
jgi:hypothetical protein